MKELNSIQIIESSQNPLIKKIKSLQTPGIKGSKARGEDGLALIEGIHLLQTWVNSKNKFDLDTVVFSENALENLEVKNLLSSVTSINQFSTSTKIKLVKVDNSLIKDVTQFTESSLILAFVRIPEVEELGEFNQNLIILDGIQDSGNVGTIFRTAAAAGYDKVICLKGTAQAWSPKVLRAAMGAHTALSIIEGVKFENILSKLKLKIFSARLTESKNLFSISSDLKAPHAWVFGNEGAGVSQVVHENSIGVFIPQEDQVESLNVAAAAAICLFEARRVKFFTQ